MCLLASMACGPTILIPEDTDSTTGSGSSSDAVSSSSASSTGAIGSTSTTGGSTGPLDGSSDDADLSSFIAPADAATGQECSILTQDCPPGEKCMPWANDGGGAWNAWGCFPVVEDPAGLYEPCSVEGSGVSGMDTCDVGLMCWNVDPETNEGLCHAMCTGDIEDPFCEDPDAVCPLFGDGAILICIPTCDPLGDDCPKGQACFGISEYFACAPDVGKVGGPGDPCEFINACEGGHACINAADVPDCPGTSGCCSPFCDLGDEAPPCLPDQVCIPWFEPEAPPGFEHVGVCALP